MRSKKLSVLMISGMLLGGVRLAHAMGETATLPFLSGENQVISAVYDSSRTVAIFGTNTGDVVRVRLSDFVITSTISVSTSPMTSAAIDPSGHYAYFGSSEPIGVVSRVDISTVAFSSSAVSMASGEGGLASVVVDSSAFAYFGTHTEPAKIVKLNLTTFTRVGSLTLASGEDDLSCAAVDSVNGFAYFGTNTIPAKIIKVNLTNFTKVGTLTLASGENNLTSAVISTTTGFGYFGTNTSPGRVIKVRLSDLSEQSTIILNAGESHLTSAVIDNVGTFAYFGTNTSPGKVVRIALANFVETFTTTLTAGEGALQAGLMDASNLFAYFGAGTTPGQVIKIDSVDSRTGPPVITAQPSNVVITPGAPAVFTVAAVGSTPITYQWTLNGVSIPGATSTSYTTGALSFSDNGSLYACIVTNALGSTASRSAEVSVKPVIKVFPNPWRSDLHNGIPITFEGAAPNSTLKIFTLSMHWVKSVTGGGLTPLTWDRVNDAGQRVASGYYFYLVTTGDDSQTVHGMFAIIQ